MKSLILIAYLLQTALAAAQLISFKDGKVGVNFFGYHAEAGLGGGQNGANGGLLGGLHASAGTPWGQNAAAGLGGNVNGRATGVLYAGAQATPDVGASAVLGGDTSQGGFSGTDAYANGKVNSHTRTITTGNTQQTHENAYPQYQVQPVTEHVNAIQKIRPPKKYHTLESLDFVEKPDYNSKSDATLTVNKNNNITIIQQDKPAAAPASATVVTKRISKTKLGTPLQQKYKKALLQADSNVSNNHGNFVRNELNTKAPTTPTTPITPTTPTSTLSYISLSKFENEQDSNTNIAKGHDPLNNPTTIVITTRQKTKLRTRAHKQRRNRKRNRINANRQRQISKTTVKVVEKDVQPEKDQEHPTETQIYRHQQQTARRQLIAPPPIPQSDPCDGINQECKTLNREVRSDVVTNALQIPIGILQSLQQSLG